MPEETTLDILLDLHRESATGVLSISSGEVQRRILFKNGNVAFVDSNVRDESLGRFLVREGKLTENNYMKAILQANEKKRLLGETLVSMGLMNPTEVFEFLQLQITEKLRNCLASPRHECQFKNQLPDNFLELEVPFFRTLLDGIASHYTPGRFKEEGEFPKEGLLCLKEEVRKSLGKFKLRPEEMRIARMLEQPIAPADFINRSNNKRLATALFFLMHKMRMLETREAEVKEAKETTPPPIKVEKPTSAANQPAAAVANAAPKPSPATPSPQSLYEALIAQQRKNHFEILQLTPEVAATEIERKYATLVKQLHLAQIDQHYPEKDRANAKQLLDRITLAYVVLKDSKKKTKYLEEQKKRKADEPDAVDPILNAETEFFKTQMHIKYSNWAEALKTIDEAIKLNPKEAEYLVTAAQVQMRLDIANGGEASNKVEEKLRRALEINMQYFRASLELGHYCKQKKDLTKALRHYQDALEKNPKCVEAEREIRLLEKREKSSKSLFETFRKKT